MAGRVRIIDSIERCFDATHTFTCDLFLPNSFINGRENSDFWFRMATIACSDGKVEDWHELEYGTPMNRDDLRQRYVYTFKLNGDTYRFYTKVLNDGCYPELVWYVGKAVGEAKNTVLEYSSFEDDIDSGNDTDTDEISLRTSSVNGNGR